MNAIGATTASPASQPERARAFEAGAQFEAVLLNTVLGPLEHSFSHLPGGKKEDQASEGYSGMAMQALTSGLARSGGIGVGKMIAEELLKHAQPEHPAASSLVANPKAADPLKDF